MLECGSRSFEVAFISAIVYLKNKSKNPVMNCQGGLEVAAVKSGCARKDHVTSFTRSITGTQVMGLFLGVAAKTTRDKAPCTEERAVHAVSTEWKEVRIQRKGGQSERNELSRLAECLCGCGCVGVIA